MRLTPWIVAAVVCFAGWKLYSQRDIPRAAGTLAADDPVQETLDAPAVERDGYLLRPRATFEATVRILHREDYSLGPMASLVPTDFAVGWGRMSDSAVLARVEISQSNRFYYWRTQDWPIPREEIESHSANWHVIADSAGVRRVLDSLRAGSVVRLSGRLVDIEGKDFGISTSLTRTDTGAGACEILLASSARVVEPR